MQQKILLWTGLGLSLGLMATNSQAITLSTKPFQIKPSHSVQLIASANSEGEGGEATGDAASQNAEYLTLLGLVEGHMTVGTALYKLGAADQAKTHMKHPKDEIYTNLLPIMKERKMKGFERELDAVANAVKSAKPASEVETLFAKLQSAIQSNRPAKLEAALAVKAIVNLLRTSGEEFAIGVKDGKIDNLHEYQDAWGFVQAAKTLLANLNQDEKTEHAAELTKVAGHLDSLNKVWPNLAAQANGIGKAQDILVAAANVELIFYAMK